jgi:hypothetical protein
LIDDLPTENTSPTKELFVGAIEFFINHDAIAPLAPYHRNLPLLLLVAILAEGGGKVNKVNPVFLG